MSISLKLRPEVEQVVLAEAAARGQAPADYLVSLIESMLPRQPYEESSIEEFEAAMDELAAGSEYLPVLPPEATSRESIYADHD